MAISDYTLTTGTATNYTNVAQMQQWPTPQLTTSLYRCTDNTHYFECRHELRCCCGQTTRRIEPPMPRELAVPEGL